MNFDDVCVSGACEGSDLEWGYNAALAGHAVIHYGFQGMNQSKNKTPYWVLNTVQLLEADPFLKKANETLQRGTFPYRSEYTNNLLRRNFWQIKNTERVYATAPLATGDMQVLGGTGWAVQMAVDQKIKEIYVFDIITSQWYTWVNTQFVKFPGPPRPHGIYTGIGSRPENLNEAAIQAIKDVYVERN